jgi:pimeloyl-ACP methyl ester carboxylesterase
MHPTAKDIQMAKDTHVTAPTRFVEAGGIRYAYRRFGAETGTPLVFLQHFRGGLDNWDPLVTDLLAQQRSVILFNNAGVAGSSGETPSTIDAMGDHVAAFVNALGLPQVDVLGFSIGGYVAQSFVLRHRHLVRRLVLAGTGPRNGEPRKNPRVSEVAGNPVPVCEDFLFLFFSPSEAGQAAGRAFWERRHQRKDADPPSSIQTMKARWILGRTIQCTASARETASREWAVWIAVKASHNDGGVSTLPTRPYIQGYDFFSDHRDGVVPKIMDAHLAFRLHLLEIFPRLLRSLFLIPIRPCLTVYFYLEACADVLLTHPPSHLISGIALPRPSDQVHALFLPGPPPNITPSFDAC